MSCVAAIVKNSTVYFMGDRYVGNSCTSDVWTMGYSKIFFKDQLLFGCVGSLRLIQMIQNTPTFPLIGEMSTMEYLMQNFVPFINSSILELCFKDEEQINILVGSAKDGLFLIGADLSIVPLCDTFFSIGAAGKVALGALYSERPFLEPVNNLTVALNASFHFTDCVRYPFDYIEYGVDKKYFSKVINNMEEFNYSKFNTTSLGVRYV